MQRVCGRGWFKSLRSDQLNSPMYQWVYTLAAIAPYALWMALLLLLQPTAANYAWRTLLAGMALVAFIAVSKAHFCALRPRVLVYGVVAGLLVGFLWVAPESFEWYRRLFILGGSQPQATSPYAPAVCGWPLTLVRLAGSAFVIAAAEEIFFRSFLYRWLQNRNWMSVNRRTFDPNAFLWMVALFAIEHDRWAAGAVAGAIYGIVYMRKGLVAAITAHVVTNLALGIYVIMRGEWGFW